MKHTCKDHSEPARSFIPELYSCHEIIFDAEPGRLRVWAETEPGIGRGIRELLFDGHVGQTWLTRARRAYVAAKTAEAHFSDIKTCECADGAPELHRPGCVYFSDWAACAAHYTNNWDELEAVSVDAPGRRRGGASYLTVLSGGRHYRELLRLVYAVKVGGSDWAEALD